jgi:hypothetical protein
VQVDRGGRVIDPLGDPPHRELLVAVAHEQIARRVEDLLAEERFLTGAPVLDSHALRRHLT